VSLLHHKSRFEVILYVIVESEDVEVRRRCVVACNATRRKTGIRRFTFVIQTVARVLLPWDVSCLSVNAMKVLANVQVVILPKYYDSKYTKVQVYLNCFNTPSALNVEELVSFCHCIIKTGQRNCLQLDRTWPSPSVLCHVWCHQKQLRFVTSRAEACKRFSPIPAIIDRFVLYLSTDLKCYTGSFNCIKSSIREVENVCY
jgi:hypothetical protein